MAAEMSPWGSHVWSSQAMARIVCDGSQMVAMQPDDGSSPIMVNQALVSFYAPGFTGPENTMNTQRNLLELFRTWLYTGHIETSDIFQIIGLNFLAYALNSVALSRATLTLLQKVNRNDELRYTQLTNYRDLSTIVDELGVSSPLYHYVQDTYFQHWHPRDDVNDSPADFGNLVPFFHGLLVRERTTSTQNDDPCSCCHDFCLYHDHESEEERHVTCGIAIQRVVPQATAAKGTPTDAESSGSSTVQNQGAINGSSRDPGEWPDIQAPNFESNRAVAEAGTAMPETAPVQEQAIDEFNVSLPERHRTLRQGLRVRNPFANQASTLESDQKIYPRRDTRSNKSQPENLSWLSVQNHAPVEYPEDYHARLVSLPSVASVTVPDWLEIGVGRKDVDKLPEPDRIIAAAMEWDAEDYAHTKFDFFSLYSASLQPGGKRSTKAKWCSNVLKFGNMKRSERLWDMWECLGWLDEHHYTGAFNAEFDSRSGAIDPEAALSMVPVLAAVGHESPAVEDSTKPSYTNVQNRHRSNANQKWTPQEDQLLKELLEEVETEGFVGDSRFEECSKRLKSRFGFDRTLASAKSRRYVLQKKRKRADSIEEDLILTEGAFPSHGDGANDVLNGNEGIGNGAGDLGEQAN